MENDRAELIIGLLTMIELLKDKFLYEETRENFVKDIEYAIECVEKQIPKKPILIDGDTAHYNCSKCSEWLDIDSFIGYYPNWCPNCGQAIDWGD